MGARAAAGFSWALSTVRAIAGRTVFERSSRDLAALVATVQVQIAASILARSNLLQLYHRDRVVDVVLGVVAVLVPASMHSVVSADLLGGIADITWVWFLALF